MTNKPTAAQERVNCRDCVFAHGDGCSYDGHKQNYERRYDDIDFCGPLGRFFQKKSALIRLMAILRLHHNGESK